MLRVHGPDRLLCLLFLLLAPHSAEGDRLPWRRFEYKLSFKGPRLALPGAGIPFWSHHGDTILGLEEVRLVPSIRNQKGAVWSETSVLFPAWEVEMQMRVTGPGHRGAQGMAVWYTQNRGQVGSVFGGLASWDGIGIFFDSSAEDTQDSPAIRVVASNGYVPSEQLGDGASHQVLGSCHRDFRNRPYPIRTRITYWRQRLRVSLSTGLTPSDPDEVCVDVGSVLLAPGGFFGVSAATSTLADDHDVLSFLTFSLNEPGPEVPPQPFLEMEQLRLARQLEGLQAKLALGSRVVIIPQPNSKAQEEGERLFDLEETLGRHNKILQDLQALSEQLAQAEMQWKKQLGFLGQARPDGAWVSSPLGIQVSTCEIPFIPQKGSHLSRSLCRTGNQDSAKISTLLYGQQTLLQALQEMSNAAAHMASGAQVFYLPVGTEHHFLELDQILSLLHKSLRDPVKAAVKSPRPSGWPPGASTCLRPGIFLFFLLIQTFGFFCYVNLRQELDKRLRECLSTGNLPLGAVPHIPRVLGTLRRQPLSPSMHA
ncbi:protein ERGIC-53-like isoform X1 [Marmota marmota marmota]|uniref:protein ERGIC-53-like isoform X1 n=1 Tax=Marmota marmota marmota TaxID=9994 RepID=UPI0007623A40|nr:protein ERGIC-53-like isoform X1 [Marmota marmota marmota]